METRGIIGEITGGEIAVLEKVSFGYFYVPIQRTTPVIKGYIQKQDNKKSEGKPKETCQPREE